MTLYLTKRSRPYIDNYYFFITSLILIVSKEIEFIFYSSVYRKLINITGVLQVMYFSHFTTLLKCRELSLRISVGENCLY